METIVLAVSASVIAGLLLAAVTGIWKMYGELKTVAAAFTAHRDTTNHRLSELEKWRRTYHQASQIG